MLQTARLVDEGEKMQRFATAVVGDQKFHFVYLLGFVYQLTKIEERVWISHISRVGG